VTAQMGNDGTRVSLVPPCPTRFPIRQGSARLPLNYIAVNPGGLKITNPSAFRIKSARICLPDRALGKLSETNIPLLDTTDRSRTPQRPTFDMVCNGRDHPVPRGEDGLILRVNESLILTFVRRSPIRAGTRADPSHRRGCSKAHDYDTQRSTRAARRGKPG